MQCVVQDPQEAAIPGATVTLTNNVTDISATGKTNSRGIYTFNALPLSHVILTVDAAGFEKKFISNVNVLPEHANAFNVSLSVGTITQTVTVSGTGEPLMNSETASTSGVINAKDIRHLPSFGRDIFKLAQFVPGIFGDGSQLPGSNSSGTGAADGIFKTENAPQIVSNGGQNEMNGISIDGIRTVSAVWGGASVITPSEESVKAVTVVSNSYDEENGRFGDAQIQVTMQNGTNQLHGSGFFKADRQGLNAYQVWNGPASEGSGTAAQKRVNRNDARLNQYCVERSCLKKYSGVSS